MQEDESAGASRAQVGGSSGSSSSAPASSPETRKRQAESQAEPEAAQERVQPDVTVPDVIADPLQDPMFSSFGSAKRLGEEYPQDGYQTLQEAKQQRVNLVDVVVEAMEEATTKIRTLDSDLQMTICEEKIDLSYLENAQADLLGEAITHTNVGGVRAQLDDQVASCMMQSLCSTDSDGVSGVQSADPSEEVESIFDPGSRMGLEAGAGEDYWKYDSSNATWIRFILVPRVDLFHPSEGVGEEKAPTGPMLSNLRNRRWAIPDGLATIKRQLAGRNRGV